MSSLEKQRGIFAVRTGKLNHLRSLSLCVLAFLAVGSIGAVSPDRRISQYGHTAWRIQDGQVDLAIAITQTKDGYIWIGTRTGLVRFDGVNFVHWLPPKGQSLPGSGFSSLLGTDDNSLWIGTTGGLARLKDGQLQSYTSEPGRSGITAIIKDHAGTIWVTRYQVPEGEGPLCRVEGKGLQCHGKADGIPVRYGLGLTEDSLGDLWFGSSELCRWKSGSPASTYFGDVLKKLNAGDGVIDVAAGPSGSVWAALDGVGPQLGVQYYSGGKWSSYVIPGFDGATVRSHTLFVDRNKSLWIGTENKGLYHVHDGVADHYGSADGLSGDSVGSIFEDHEGNLWVITDSGIDMFRDTPIVSFATPEGLSAANIASIVASRNGSVWLANEGAVDILREGGTSALPISHELSGHDIGTMFEDHTGTMWLGIDRSSRLIANENGRSLEIKKPDGSVLGFNAGISAIGEDVEHNIWALTAGRQQHSHLFRIADQRVREDIDLGNGISPAYLVADRDAGIWLLSRRGELARYREGHLQMFSLGHHENTFSVRNPLVDLDDSLWIPTSAGLLRWNDGRLNILDTSNGLPCTSIFSAIKDNNGSLWLSARCGLMKLEASELAKWMERPDSHLAVKIFGRLDGAYPSMGATLQPIASKAPDGRLWFTNGILAQVIDPGRLYSNTIPPPVYIDEIVADHKRYEPQENLRLPPLTRELEIDYTALSFSTPRRVRFRYKLEGADSHWEEPDTRRQAFYSDLGPGKYRFRVVACNSDGIWNDVGATRDFSIAPAWYQTYWFRLLSVVLVVLAMWLLYSLRVRHIARAIRASFDERLAERTRLARELHDTLLQTIQGSKMVADDALEQSSDPVRMRRAMERLSEWLGKSMQEVRTALNSLRTSTTQGNDLAESLQRATEDCTVKGFMQVIFSVVGTAQEMHPIVRDEIYRIGYEAIRNADNHSKANLMEVELSYARDLVMRIRDNGIGIDMAVANKGREGHFGLRGMRERAERIGATFMLVSSTNAGTEITLVVPGGIVFRKPDAAPSGKSKLFFSRSVGRPTDHSDDMPS